MAEVKKGLWAVGSIITGIIAIVLCWIPIFGFILGIVAVVICGIGLKRIHENRGLIITGLVFGIIATLVSIPITLGTFLIAGVVSNINTGKQEAINLCPDLSGMKIDKYDSLMQTWIAIPVEYNKDNVKITYPDTTDLQGKSIIYCDKGSSEGQNPDYVYCGDWIRPIILNQLENDGSIKKKISVEVVFDSKTKQYVKTVCDTYLV